MLCFWQLIKYHCPDLVAGYVVVSEEGGVVVGRGWCGSSGDAKAKTTTSTRRMMLVMNQTAARMKKTDAYQKCWYLFGFGLLKLQQPSEA